MSASASPIRSIYRGQARSGIGEGPGHPIAHGEQYLHGTDPQSAADGELLQAIRPWLSLDSDPADHQRLQDRLEAWSSFIYREALFVVRLVSAGIYDRRAAYFSHARAWSLADCHGGFDPGALLGASARFDGPSAPGEAEARLRSTPPGPVRLEQLTQETATAVRFLGHLLQALEQGYPLIIAAPVRDFAAEAPLHALVSFARAGLPADLKERCCLRVYTRQPERFLQHLHASLIVVPDSVAGEALAAERRATLLDRLGEVKAGRPLESRAAAYAQAVLEGALQIPRGLLLFSERFGSRHQHGLPDGDDPRAVQISYNIALALAGSATDRDYLFQHYLRAQARAGADLPWTRLLDTEDWAAFPHPTLCDFVLLPPEELTPGERTLQQVVAAALGRLGRWVDERLPVLDRTDGSRRHWGRLLELLVHAPPLVSAPAAAARSAPWPLAFLKGLSPLHGLLRAEWQAGKLARRAGESTDLAPLAADPDNRRVLIDATAAGDLAPDWAVIYLDRVANREQVLELANALLDPAADRLRWGRIPSVLLDRLRALRPLPAELLSVIERLGMALDPLADWDLYLRLAELPAPAAARTNVLMQRLWRRLPEVTDPDRRRQLVAVALDEREWHCLQPASLVTADGEPALPWAEAVAEPLLTAAAVRDRLHADALLQLAQRVEPPNPELQQLVFATLTAKLRTDLEGTTRALVRHNAWYAWRRRLEPSGPPARAAALAWLRCPEWRGARRPEATRETWNQVLDDLLQEGLSGPEMRQLRDDDPRGRPRWPLIPPFEREQLAGLSGLAADLGALAELVEAVTGDESPGVVLETVDYVFNHSPFARRPAVPATALIWLIEHPQRDVLPRPELDLEQSAWLYVQAGHRREPALQARIDSIVFYLRIEPLRALAAAAQPDLWNNDIFLNRLARWLSDLADPGSRNTLDGKDVRAALACLEQHIDPARSPRLPRSAAHEWLAQQLVIGRYPHTAEFLAPGAGRRAQKERLSFQAAEALCANRSDDDCWQRICQVTVELNTTVPSPLAAGPPATEHPLSRLATLIRTRAELTPQELETLLAGGWPQFIFAVRKHPALLQPLQRPRLSLPAFELAASLKGDGALGQAATGLIAAAHFYRGDPLWWRALLRSLRHFRRYGTLASVDDRQDTALVMIQDYAKRSLNPNERRLLLEALQLEYGPQAVGLPGLRPK